MTGESLRAQPMEKLEMANGNTSWIKAETRANMDKIYEWLEKQFKGRVLGTAQLTFSYKAISNKTGIHHNRVSFACNKLANLKNQVVRIHARRRVSKEGVKTYEGVELLRRIHSEIPEKRADINPIHPTP